VGLALRGLPVAGPFRTGVIASPFTDSRTDSGNGRGADGLSLVRGRDQEPSPRQRPGSTCTPSQSTPSIAVDPGSQVAELGLPRAVRRFSSSSRLTFSTLVQEPLEHRVQLVIGYSRVPFVR
jgi:hypothetical protein